jgi:putative MATE family efflux protein
MFRDREYLSTLIKIALPISIQNLIGTSLNAVGVLLIGQLGETSVAAVGLANQVFFLLNLMLFGIVSGSAIFTAQFWGSGDLPGIRKVVGLCLGLAVAAGVFFTVAALGFPRQILGFYTQDPAVIELGTSYLRIIGYSYLPTAITFTYAVQMRATGNVRTPMLVSAGALSLGTAINYALIFGKFGLPALGVEGAAVGTTIARLIECAAMLAVTYARRSAIAVLPADLRGLPRDFTRRYLITVLPVAANETIWALGITIYNSIYAHIGTEAIAAVNITSTIEALAFVVLIGIANATAIMIGNRIGAGEEEKAYRYAWRSLAVVVTLAVLIGAALILLAPTIISYYKISETAAVYARGVLTVLGVALVIRSSNLTIIVGILRSGGDTRFPLVLDVGTVWLVGVPMALLGAFVLHLPVYWVAAMVMTEEVVKLIGGLYRFLSRKWINNLARTMA